MILFVNRKEWNMANLKFLFLDWYNSVPSMCETLGSIPSIAIADYYCYYDIMQIIRIIGCEMQELLGHGAFHWGFKGATFKVSL